jgi:hypothetical protein
MLPGCSKPKPDTATPECVESAGNLRSAQLYPTPKGSVSFPEMQNPRYQKQVGVAISGGSMRSFSSCIGQLSALTSLGLLPEVGHMSTLSGSSWFGSIFNYVDPKISDETLLGEFTPAAPESLTLAQLEKMHTDFIGYPVAKLDDKALGDGIRAAKKAGFLLNRRFGAAIGKVLLGHFGLYKPEQYFSLDEASVADLIARNPGFRSEDFVTMREGRPYWIASSSVVDIYQYPPYMHQFEYSPLYSGTAQVADGLGGGYVENIGFNTGNPIEVTPDNLARVEAPPHAFTLFDLMGSSGAAPGIVFDKLRMPGVMAEFNYWPVDDPIETKAELHSFVDGGDLEDTSLVAILRRNYSTVVSFINGAYPLGTKGKDTVQGVNSNITRLFGLRPKDTTINNQDTQIFENEAEGSSGTPFDALVEGLHATRDAKELAHHQGTYRIKANNPFGLEPREVTILWIYNDLNHGWAERLPKEISKLFDERVSRQHLGDFPNYKSVFQDDLQMFSLTSEQVQLLANMWHFSLCEPTTLRTKLEALF